MPIRAVLGELVGREGVLVRRVDEGRPKIARVVRVRDRRRRRGAELAHERPEPHGQPHEVVRRKCEDGVLLGVVRHGGVRIRLAADGFGALPVHRHAHDVLRVEDDRVAVHHAEGRDRLARRHVAHGVLADALDARLGPPLARVRVALGHVRVALVVAVHELVVPRGRGHRGDGDVADADGEGVAGRGAVDVDGLGDLVAAVQARGDHRAPAAGCRVGDDGAAVAHGAEHLGVWVEHAVGERVDDEAASGGGLLGNLHSRVGLASRNGWNEGDVGRRRQRIGTPQDAIAVGDERAFDERRGIRMGVGQRRAQVARRGRCGQLNGRPRPADARGQA